MNIKGAWSRDVLECSVLGWLTITNLRRSKVNALCRMISTIFWTTFNTISVLVILIICNTDPGIVTLPSILGDDIVWSELPLVQDLSMLNILIITTICLGWLAMVLDVIIASARFQYRGPNDKIKKDQDKEEDGSSDKKDQDNEHEHGLL